MFQNMEEAIYGQHECRHTDSRHDEVTEAAVSRGRSLLAIVAVTSLVLELPVTKVPKDKETKAGRLLVLDDC